MSAERALGDDLDLWLTWKRAHEVVRAQVVEDVVAETGLSDPDVAILIRLDYADGALRQGRLAEKLGWDRSRLSHQLTRMEARALLTRTRVPGGVEVALSAAGRKLAAAARPICQAAVRRHLVDVLPAGQLEVLRSILDRLAGNPVAAEASR